MMNDKSLPLSSLEPADSSVKNVSQQQDPLLVSCSRVIALLGEYTDGDLSAIDQARLESHLSSCPTCARDAAEYLDVIRLIGMLPAITPPTDVELRLRSLIADAIKRSQMIDNSMDETLPEKPSL
jgi:hypothetical protein